MPSVFVPIPNCVSVQMVHLVQGQICENVYHVAVGAPPTSTSMNAIAAAFKTWWLAHLQAMEPTQVSVDNIIVTDLSSQLGGTVDYVTGLPISGTNATPTAPMNVTVAIKWLTGNRGRSYRGRSFHIQLRTDQYTGSVLNGTNAADLTTNYNALITAITAGGWMLAVASRIQNKVPRITGLATFITGLAVDPVIDSQRRRLPGRGR